MGSLSISQPDQAAALANAGHKYGVPAAILVGMYGVETAYGTNVTNSSAGAVGPFQFTGADKGTGVLYPMTNTPTLAQFQQQADAAAAYLAALYKQTGGNSWTSALAAYNAGPGNIGAGAGYAQNAVAAGNSSTGQSWLKAIGFAVLNGAGAPPDVKGASTNPGQIVSNVVSGVSSAVTSTGDFLNLITSLSFWLRVGEAIAGMILLAMGLRALTGAALPMPMPIPEL